MGTTGVERVWINRVNHFAPARNLKFETEIAPESAETQMFNIADDSESACTDEWAFDEFEQFEQQQSKHFLPPPFGSERLWKTKVIQESVIDNSRAWKTKDADKSRVNGAAHRAEDRVFAEAQSHRAEHVAAAPRSEEQERGRAEAEEGSDGQHEWTPARDLEDAGDEARTSSDFHDDEGRSDAVDPRRITRSEQRELQDWQVQGGEEHLFNDGHSPGRPAIHEMGSRTGEARTSFVGAAEDDRHNLLRRTGSEVSRKDDGRGCCRREEPGEEAATAEDEANKGYGECGLKELGLSVFTADSGECDDPRRRGGGQERLGDQRLSARAEEEGRAHSGVELGIISGHQLDGVGREEENAARTPQGLIAEKQERQEKKAQRAKEVAQRAKESWEPILHAREAPNISWDVASTVAVSGRISKLEKADISRLMNLAAAATEATKPDTCTTAEEKDRLNFGIIEFCCESDSMLGKVSQQMGIDILRVDKRLDCMDLDTFELCCAFI